jgi:ribonuclease P protein component
VFAKSRRSADAFFTILAARREDNSAARLGLAISKKQLRRAVDRNRLKRLARDVFRLHRAHLEALDFVVMARVAASTTDNRTLCDALLRHFLRLAKTVKSPIA